MTKLAFLFLFFISSCSQISYLTEQGFSQLKLQWSGVENSELMKDPKVDAETKRKIKLIEEYKKFFYAYFQKSETSIYTKTSVLEQEAVTYLLIASPHTSISAHEFNFPFFGSFPYLGFFSKQSALNYAERLAKKGLVTWIRPVYAYSTLGYLEDRILSSFFYYSDLDLAELIFHELFHTIFFIRDDVDLNENLANYFGKELVKIYFKNDPRLAEYEKSLGHEKKVASKIVTMIELLEGEFKKFDGQLTDSMADQLTKDFIEGTFIPQMRDFCLKESIEAKICMSETDWNQARFAAFLTYEEKQDEISDIQAHLKLTPRDFYLWLEKEKELIRKKDKEELDFIKYFNERVKK